MSVTNKNFDKSLEVFDKQKFDSLNKKYYGLNDKDLSEISIFIDDFNNAMNDIDDSSDGYESLKNIVDVGNKIPAHCGYIVCDYYTNSYGNENFNKILLKLYYNYKTLFSKDPESTKTTDLYEVLACLIQFAPPKTLRKFIIENFEISKEIYKNMRKRPSSNATMSARYSELFVTSKFDNKYSDLIYENYKAMLDFLKQKDWEIDKVNDAVKINFNQLRDIIKDYYEKDRKESLKKINKLINKKADIGEAFFYWIALNQSCATEVIAYNKQITGEFIENFLCQLKVQHVIELAVILENIPKEKLTFMEYIKTAYKIDSIDNCYDRLTNITKKDDISIYGILLRQVSFYPNIELDNENNAFMEVLFKLQKKLSSVANNLTASISEKSMSITIVPLGRSRTYQDIIDKISGDNEEGSFAAKLREKDIVKRIRESGLSWYTMDQNTGKTMIAIIEILYDIYKNNSKILKQEAIKIAYKELVLKYGIIVTVPFFKYIFEELEDKIVNKTNDSDVNEDYEEIY